MRVSDRLVWPLCGYRCLTLRLVKLNNCPHSCKRWRWRGGGMEVVLYMDTVLTYGTVLCLLNASAFLSCARKGYIVFELNCHFLRNDLVMCFCISVCVCHTPAGTLLAWWCVCHAYWEEGYRVAEPGGRWECTEGRGNRPNLRKAGSFLFWVHGTQRTLS